MQITNQCKPHKQAFKGEDDNVIAYDDEISRMRRCYIREHYNSWHIPYQSIYKYDNNDNCGKFSNAFINNKKYIDSNAIEELPLRHLCQISETSYRGSSAARHLECLKDLKKAGIQRIIDFAGYPQLDEACKKEGLDCFHYYIDDPVEYFFDSDLFKTKDEVIEEAKVICQNYKNQDYVNKTIEKEIAQQRKTIDKFTDFICNMQKGFNYVGCEHGLTRTDIALILNYLFNPDSYLYKNDNLMYYYYYVLESAEKLYQNLTDEDKAKMKWTKNFDDNFMSRLNQLKASK